MDAAVDDAMYAGTEAVDATVRAAVGAPVHDAVDAIAAAVDTVRDAGDMAVYDAVAAALRD